MSHYFTTPQKQTYTAKKKAAGVYIYRQHSIELVEDSGYRAWNIFDKDGESVDAAETLRGAKRLVDMLKR